jgi:hypothetical protein
VVTRLELRCLKQSLYSPEMSFKNGGNGLLKPIDTMFYAIVAVAITSGLPQNPQLVKLAEIKI